MTNLGSIVAVALLLAGCGGRIMYQSEAYGGTVVDVDTGRPLADAVVVAIWYREANVIGGHGPARDYHDSHEALTDAQGRFLVPPRTHFSLLGKITRPSFVAYAPGYAAYPSLRALPAGEDVAQAYARRYFDFRLGKLVTYAERIRNAGYPTDVLGLPDTKIIHLTRLVNVERRSLALEPLGR